MRRLNASPAHTRQMLELREAQLVAYKDLRDLREIEVATGMDQIPSRLEVDAYGEQVALGA